METPGTIKYQISLIQNGMLYFSSRESVVGKLLLDRLDSLYTSFGKLQRTFPNTIRVPPGSPPELSSRAGGHLRFIQGSLEDIQSEIERIERAKTIPSPFRYLRITERIENELDYIQEEIKALREDVIHHVKSTKKSSAGRQEGGLSAILANEGIDITRSRDLESAENILNTLFVRLSNIETKSKKGKIHAFFQPE